jgi:hypothetical protein
MGNKKSPSTKKLSEKLASSNLVLRRYAEAFGVDYDKYQPLIDFQKLSGSDRIKMARKVIKDSVIDARETPDGRFRLAIEESESLLKGYATLDGPHRIEIANLMQNMALYLRDSTRKRPFNALMLAAPGAGKSHFISKLAATMKAERVQAVSFNMATMQSADDMAQPVDELRNLKVNDRFPLLFLDEFDSDPARYPALLPLLWDGTLQVGHRDLRLGKAVIILAGSSPDLPKAMNQSAKMGLDVEPQSESSPTGKLVDLLSRINGGIINIPDFDLRTGTRDRRVDKVCVAIALLRDRFGSELAQVPRALLRFIAHTTFRYGVRSIAHLIDVIHSDAFRDGSLNLGALHLPSTSEETLRESSLRLHLVDKDQAFGIVNRWLEFIKDEAMVIIGKPGFEETLLANMMARTQLAQEANAKKELIHQEK